MALDDIYSPVASLLEGERNDDARMLGLFLQTEYYSIDLKPPALSMTQMTRFVVQPIKLLGYLFFTFRDSLQMVFTVWFDSESLSAILRSRTKDQSVTSEEASTVEVDVQLCQLGVT